MDIKKMRLPTCEEYDLLAIATKEDNDIIHGNKMYFWCQDTNPNRALARAIRGFHSARSWDWYTPPAANRRGYIGFRPVINVLDSDRTTVTIGTLYMDGQPVKVPQNPVWDGDIPNYIPGTKLEMRAALDDPAYRIQTIKVGGILIADRVLVRNISWEDLHEQGFC